MVSSKELRYVDSWANKTPMPGIEYSLRVLDDVERCYKLYNEKYKDKEYSIIFSDSEEIDFEILSKNLCHMMGIDYSNIKGEYFDSYRQQAFGTSSTDISSYDLLELIIENKEKVAELDNDQNNPAKAVNYYKSAVKCAIFNKFSSFESFNFAAINYLGDKENIDYEKSKLLFIPSNEAITPYFMMGIKECEDIENETKKYLVYTLIAPENPKSFFDNQEVIIPTQILVSNNANLSKLVATSEEKIQLLTMYENIINKYNLPNKINIFGDYKDMLNSRNYQKIKK